MLPDFNLSASLGLHAIGNISAAPIEEGVHLRWGFEPELGFPAHGFQLYRRPALQKYKDICIRISPVLQSTLLQQYWITVDGAVVRYSRVPCPTSRRRAFRDALTQVQTSGSRQCRRFDVELPHPVLLNAVWLQSQSGWALVIGLRNGKPVAVKDIRARGTVRTDFDAILVDSVVIYTAAGVPSAICYLDPQQLITGEWSDNLLPAPDEPDFGFGLPLTHIDYNLHHRFENAHDPGSGDLREAQERVRSTGHILDAADFANLRTSLSAMVDHGIPGRMFDREVFQKDEDTPPFFERPLDLSLLFSLDPIMARILGLYFVDQRIERLHVYDYLLIGRWAAWQLPRPARVYSFATVPEGTYIPRSFALGGVFLHLPTGGRVMSFPRSSREPCRKALQVRHGNMFRSSSDPAVLRFNEPMRWVLMEFGERTDNLHLSARRFGVEVDAAVVPAGNTPVHVLVQAEANSFLHLVISGGDFDLYGFRALPESEAAISPDELFLAPVSLATVLFGVQFTDAPPLSPPENLRLHGVPMPTSEQLADSLLDAGQPIHVDPQGLGLRWDPPPAVGVHIWPADLGRRVPTDAAAYQVRYQHLGNGIEAEPINPDRWTPAADMSIAVAPPAIPGEGPKKRPVEPGEDLGERFPATRPPRQDEFPPDADLWLQPWVPEGWYAGSVRARDVFGRLSSWTEGGPALADQITPPPPPLNVQAKLLQANDPGLTANEQELIAAYGDGCIKVTWDWKAHMRRQAPHATHFRIYVKRRPFNHFRVLVSAPRPGALQAHFTCTVEADIPLPLNGLIGSNLIDQGTTPFGIVANTEGSVSTLTLGRHVFSPLLPTEGIAALSIVPGFSVRVTSVEPGDEPDQLTCVVRCGLPLVADTLASGDLTDKNGVAFRIVTNTDGWTSTLTLQRDPSTPDLLPAKGRATISVSPASNLYENSAYFTAWEARLAQIDLTDAASYEVIVPPVDIVPTGSDPVRHARIGVTAADDSSRVADQFTQPAGPPWDPALGGLNGREGGVSAPASIVAVYRQTLPVPQEPRRDRLYTSPPDFYGRAFYELRWPHVDAEQRGHTVWKVLRTTDRALFALYHPEQDKSDIDVRDLSIADQTELEAAHIAHRAPLISDEVIQRLANQPGADQAFVAANREPLRSMGDEMVFVDAVDGKNPVRYLYRLRTEDDAGNLSPLSQAGLPIHVPNTYPPTPVRVSECRGGERQVTLQWVPNPEPDLAGYLVFSTEAGLTLDTLEELRLLRRPIDAEHGEIQAYDREGNLIPPTLIVSKAEADGMLNDEGRVTLVQAGLPGLQAFHYRLAAFDTAGNPSAWTRIYTARTTGIERPAPPTWNPPVTEPDGLHLSWTSPTADLNCLVQRSLDGRTWTNATRWLGRGNYEAVDKDYVAGVLTHYRLRVRLPNGQVNKEYEVLDV